ncbi:hypothetical protein PanWU01x14_249410 [Parasponia andersonii]|uniref:Uncharacterized protein n=1 Tax=Parasponia andersonii TaxID=3476 RepID=A0A2P5BD96_PARAD|nr:hypothetical protein PanWU01x14_249410 [Parasponia andersonii]
MVVIKTSQKVVSYFTLATSHKHFKLTLHRWSVLLLRKYDLFVNWIPVLSTYTRVKRLHFRNSVYQSASLYQIYSLIPTRLIPSTSPSYQKHT